MCCALRTPRNRPTGRGVTRRIWRSWPPAIPSRSRRSFATCGVVAAPADALTAVGEMLAPVVAQARAVRGGAGRTDPAGFSGGPGGFDPPVAAGSGGSEAPEIEVHVVAGGATRQLSVAAALA